MPDTFTPQLDGRAATAAEVARLALANHGHFTTFMVEQGGVRGLGLHLQRLDAASRELFGREAGASHLRACIRRAVALRPDGALRVSVWAAEGNARPPVLVSARPVALPVRPLRLRSVQYRRPLPHLKHAGILGLMQLRASARAEGFDDVLLLDEDGHVLEGSFWNLGALVQDTVIWPRGPRLEGTTLQLLDAALAGAGRAPGSQRLHRDRLVMADAVFACNALTGVQPIGSIDGKPLPQGALAPLRALLAAVPAERP